MDFEGGAAGGGDAGVGAGSAADFLGGGAAGAGGSAGGADGGAGAGGAGVGEQEIGGGADPSWYGDLSGEAQGESASNRDWIKSKGVKDLDGLVKSYRDAERGLRDSGRVRIPGEGASEAEVREFHKAIGVPDDAKGYQVSVPAGEDGKPLTWADGSEVKVNAELVDRIAAVAHKSGVPAAAFNALVQEVLRNDIETAGAAQAEQVAEANQVANSWGAQREEKLAAIGNAAEALGITSAEMLAIRSAWGPKRAMEMFATIGAGIREDTMISGDKRTFGVGGAEAQSEINRLKADPEFQKKVMVPGSPESERWKRLQEAAGQYADRRAAQGL